MTTAIRSPIAARCVQKVLAVDDEEIMGYVIQRIVRHLGYEVDWVTSCETALEKIKAGSYDVILSDFKTPTMDGERFYNEIAGLDKSLLKKVIFITGDTVSGSTLRFFKKAEVPFLSKPFQIDELERLIRQAAQVR
jgi:two-component system, NtrC family, response regulator PilR